MCVVFVCLRVLCVVCLCAVRYALLSGVVWFGVVVSECAYVCVCLKCVLFVTYCVMLSGLCALCVCLFVCLCFF